MTGKALALAGLLAAALALGGCGEPQASAGAGGDRFAGLDEAIRVWRADIQQSDAACRAGKGDKACQSFEVACKGERALTSLDQARGVSARVVVAMRWQGWNPEKSEFQSAPGFAEFAKVGSDWRREEAPRVNLATCA